MTRARDLAAFVSNADGDIKFDTDTLFIDSSANRVGIGTTTPDRSLHIAGNPGMIVLEDTGGSTDDKRAALFADSGAFEIASKNDDDSTRLNDIFVADLGTGAIRMGDTGGTSTSRQKSFIISHQTGQSSEYGGLEFFRAHQNSQKVGASIMHVRPGSSLDDSDMVFKTSSTNANATERMRILHSGGLTFNGDTAAANALDDYETGTWTPTVTNSSMTGAVTYTSHLGYYVKVGSLVNAVFFIEFQDNNATGGNVQVHGLPFVVENLTGHFPQAAVMIDNLKVALNNPHLQIANNTTRADLITSNGSTTTHGGVNFNAFVTGTTATINFRASLVYRTSA